MGYKMKTSISKLLGINAELSTYDVPVFEKNLPKKILGTANIDRTIYVDKRLSEKDKKDVVEHEKMHINQFRSGEVSYDSKNIYYRKTPFSPIQKILRDSIQEGAHNLPWEASIYKKTGVFPDKIKKNGI
tara:strand:+ start:1367 stop:1756 length:390 start_codon:yes stop_codon:yes gene_type:complete